ncbi:MAG: hypothetical protein V1808_01925 [Candidatus Daviesbacteria bacterium]
MSIIVERAGDLIRRAASQLVHIETTPREVVEDDHTRCISSLQIERMNAFEQRRQLIYEIAGTHADPTDPNKIKRVVLEEKLKELMDKENGLFKGYTEEMSRRLTGSKELFILGRKFRLQDIEYS